MIGAFYAYGKNHFSGTEDIWEGAFSLIASVIITVMGAALLRVSKLQEKWRVKLAQAMETKDRATSKHPKWSFKKWAEKYAMFILPFVTVLREGLEAVVFIGGVSVSFPATAFPLPVVTGLLAGAIVGYLIYRYVHIAIVLVKGVHSNSDFSQRRQPSIPPNLPHHLHLLPLPCRRRSLLPRNLVPRK